MTIDEARAALFEGNLVVTITSPLGGAVKFRFTPRVPGHATAWDGQEWWLFRGREYVGIVRRAGSAFDLRYTDRSTTDRMIRKAAAIILTGFRDGLDGYELS